LSPPDTTRAQLHHVVLRVESSTVDEIAPRRGGHIIVRERVRVRRASLEPLEGALDALNPEWVDVHTLRRRVRNESVPEHLIPVCAPTAVHVSPLLVAASTLRDMVLTTRQSGLRSGKRSVLNRRAAICYGRVLICSANLRSMSRALRVWLDIQRSVSSILPRSRRLARK